MLLKSIRTLFYMELVLHIRRSQEWLYPIFFFCMAVSFLPFILSQELAIQSMASIAPGYFWIIAVFSSILSIQTFLASDFDDKHLEQIMLSPTPFYFSIMIKLFVQWLLTQLPLILLTPFLALLFGLDKETILLLCSTLLIGTPVLTLVGSFAMALSFGIKQSATLLSLLILPLITPIFIFGVNIIVQANAGLAINGSIAFLAGLPMLSLVILPALISYVLMLTME